MIEADPPAGAGSRGCWLFAHAMRSNTIRNDCDNPVKIKGGQNTISLSVLNNIALKSFAFYFR